MMNCRSGSSTEAKRYFKTRFVTDSPRNKCTQNADTVQAPPISALDYNKAVVVTLIPLTHICQGLPLQHIYLVMCLSRQDYSSRTTWRTLIANYIWREFITKTSITQSCLDNGNNSSLWNFLCVGFALMRNPSNHRDQMCWLLVSSHEYIEGDACTYILITPRSSIERIQTTYN